MDAMDLAVAPGGLLVVPMSREAFAELDVDQKVEWYDGMCVVNPPVRRHQAAAFALAQMLDAVIAPTEQVLVEWGWRTAEGEFRPDVMVFRRDDPDDEVLKVAPRLAVEVLSPSNRLADLVRKPELYAAAGLPWYWVVDLAEPSVRVLAERDGTLVEVQRLTGPGTTVGPYEVVLDPAALGR